MNRSYIENLYRHSFGLLCRAATTVIRHRADAEDVVHDVFIALLEGDADHLPPGPELDTFVMAEVLREASDRVSPPVRPPNVIPFVRPRTVRRRRAA